MYKITNGNTILRLADNAYIPPDIANSDYGQYLVWLSNGNTPAPVDTPSAETLASIERQWRDTELDKADIQLNKLQDGGGTGAETEWRRYRVELRNWPAAQGFPDAAKRPCRPQ
ncbi:MAG: phage tail assembly chaperone [Pseudomonadaceae bacterium]|nr:phage tail assembly chaperone [Pseudomonadaceae bacterium]